jgi:hypothetical protein
MGGTCAKHGRDEINTKFWSKNLKGRDHLEDPGIGNTRMDLRKTGWEGADWLHLAQDRENGNDPSGSIQGREFLD